jgi:hypothetical protein
MENGYTWRKIIAVSVVSYLGEIPPDFFDYAIW